MMKSLASLPETTSRIWPGLLVASVIAITAQFLSEHYGAPAMLLALLLGIAFHFLTEND
ncbi:MAG: putative sulfate exporter family transporter, partial [Pseudomonadota bacterium]